MKKLLFQKVSGFNFSIDASSDIFKGMKQFDFVVSPLQDKGKSSRMWLFLTMLNVRFFVCLSFIVPSHAFLIKVRGLNVRPPVVLVQV